MNTNVTNKGEIILYSTPDGQTKIEVRLVNETVWLNTKQMSALFDREESNMITPMLWIHLTTMTISVLHKELYPSVEEKAAMLLYLVTKNHFFSDGKPDKSEQLTQTPLLCQ